MVDVRRVNLPGVGVLHSFTTVAGVEIAVVAHRSGASSLTTRVNGDDVVVPTVRLEEDEARTLAELLGGTRIVESIAELDDLPGVPIDWVTVDDGDVVVGRRLGELTTPDGVSIVALVRDQRAIPTPGSDLTVQGGDILVAVGPAESVDGLFRELARPAAEGRTD
jgi:TrkA domain protein